MRKQTVSRRLKYPVPQFKMALLREKEGKTFEIFRPSDVEEFVEPLKHCSDYVSQENMFRRSPEPRYQPGGGRGSGNINVIENRAISAALHHRASEHQRGPLRLMSVADMFSSLLPSFSC